MTIEIGDSALDKRIITEDDINLFSNISGDKNRLHIDESFAKESIFGRRVAHGLFVSSFISAVIANKLPGEGSIYLDQKLSFRRPVFIDDEITTIVTVSGFPKPGFVSLTTVCKNQDEQEVILGEALVKLPN